MVVVRCYAGIGQGAGCIPDGILQGTIRSLIPCHQRRILDARFTASISRDVGGSHGLDRHLAEDAMTLSVGEYPRL